MEITGDIISGEFDQFNDEFVLHQVKQFPTASTLNRDQFNTVYEYLNKHKDEAGGQVLTLNEQMLVHLSQEESSQFISDLEKIRPMFH